MAFQEAQTEINNTLQEIMVKNKLTPNQMLLILGDMLHIYLTLQSQEAGKPDEDVVHR